MRHNKRKILNDPVYGFISIPDDLVFDIIEHPYFQRLRRIQQLGMTHLVYPGALHTRFHHAIGAMYLMRQALDVIVSKGYKLSHEELLGATLAILLHDIGHGPFSHALEFSIIKDIKHEEVSLEIMKALNNEFNNQISEAIDIFSNQHSKKCLHQLVAGQTDTDRLDYLTRDSFFTGVSEGIIGTERIISMMQVVDDKLVIEEKGLFSIEKFIIARQLMYWQVYYHKTVVSAEVLLIKILQRAHFLALQGVKVPASSNLEPFLNNEIDKNVFLNSSEYLSMFCRLDDFDVISSIKSWMEHKDKILSDLSARLLNRRLFKTVVVDYQLTDDVIREIKNILSKKMNIHLEDVQYYFYYGAIETFAYELTDEPIKIVYKNGKIRNINEASTILNFNSLKESKKKYTVTYPKEYEKDIMLCIKESLS